tara:strand:+ start:440 stop:1123 length:684 start_codon:yes stop_codon:yes gene_type:complete
MSPRLITRVVLYFVVAFSEYLLATGFFFLCWWHLSPWRFYPRLWYIYDMVTSSAALTALGEETASELLERSFDLLTVSQRRFLVARIENDTDAAALRQAHVGQNALAHWRSTSVSFEKIYLAAKRSTPAEMSAINGMRFGYVAGKCLTIIEEFITDEIDPDEIAAGIHVAKQARANFALSFLKELRSRSARPGRINEKQSNLTENKVNVLELTEMAMRDNGKDDEQD